MIVLAAFVVAVMVLLVVVLVMAARDNLAAGPRVPPPHPRGTSHVRVIR